MKRTKQQKIRAQASRVNTQLSYNFNKSYNQIEKNNNANISAESKDLGSIKKELFRSLSLAILILIALLMLYWVSWGA